MLKCASVYTYEVDDQKTALSEIKDQLDEKIELKDNTIGVIMCHPEFISSGTMRFICSNLPFDTVGVTSAAQAVNGEAGELILTIFIITSDDVRFKAGVTDCLEKSVDAHQGAALTGCWSYDGAGLLTGKLPAVHICLQHYIIVVTDVLNQYSL